MNPQPSAEAVALAAKLRFRIRQAVCDVPCKPLTPTEIAEIIDCELKLPQRNAALLLAQNLVDAYDRSTDTVDAVFVDELREALKAIKTP